MSIMIRDDRHMRSLTGLNREQFEILLEAFGTACAAMKERAYRQGLADGTRKRRPGGGKKGALPTVRDKLLFLLYYFKVYPTFDVLGTQFSMSRSKANENLYRLCPALYNALVGLEVMPYREFTGPDELLKALGRIDTVLIDVTERNYRRPKDGSVQRDHYSGKKTTYCQEYGDVVPEQSNNFSRRDFLRTYARLHDA